MPAPSTSITAAPPAGPTPTLSSAGCDGHIHKTARLPPARNENRDCDHRRNHRRRADDIHRIGNSSTSSGRSSVASGPPFGIQLDGSIFNSYYADITQHKLWQRVFATPRSARQRPSVYRFLPPGRIPLLSLAHKPLPFALGLLLPPAYPGRHRLLGGRTAISRAWRGGLDGVRGLEGLDPLGEFGDSRRCFGALLRSCTGKADLELVTQGRQFGQVSVVEEGRAEAGLVVAELGLGKRQVLPHAGTFRAVAAGQALQGVEDGPRAVVLA